MMKALYLSTTGDDITELPTTLDVEGYGVGVFELSGKVKNGSKQLFLCCDICEESIVNGSKMPILRTLNRNSNGVINRGIYNVIWLRVMRPNITSIRLYIADEFGRIVSVAKNKLNCTLLFVPNPKES